MNCIKQPQNCNMNNQANNLPFPSPFPNLDQTILPEGAFAQGGSWGQSTPINTVGPSSPLSMQGAVMPLPEDAPPTLTEYIYTPGYLRANIGALMRVEFLIGNATTDRVGVLREVGASYIVLDALDGGSRMMCDIYSIKFVTILQSPAQRALAALG